MSKGAPSACMSFSLSLAILSDLAQSYSTESPWPLSPSHPSACKDSSGPQFLPISGKSITPTQAHHKIKFIFIWLPQHHLLSQVLSLASLMERLCFGEESQHSALFIHKSVPKAFYMWRQQLTALPAAEGQSGSLAAPRGVSSLLVTLKLRRSFSGPKRSLLRQGDSEVLSPSQGLTWTMPFLSQVAQGSYIPGMSL